ncbi:MAG: transcriptional regulator [Muribaculaceae bacterium]|nr:transcriptional regulator [Muribaculaceae bacterium]
MKNLCRGIILTLFTILSFEASAQSSEYRITPEIEGLLQHLDSLLNESAAINTAKDIRLDELRSSYNRANDPEKRYWLASNLYEEYSAYDSDSAMTYALRARKHAQGMGRQDLVTDMDLNRSYVFSATGLLDEAYRVLTAIDEKRLTEPQLWKYADRMLFLSSHRDQYVGDHGRDTAYPDEIDSLLQEVLPRISPSDRYYSWITGWGHFKNKEEAKEAIKDIKPIVDNSKFTTRDDALNAWMLSKLYEYAGDLTLKLKYLILSAMADIRASNKEIASLEEVGAILYELGDLERSNTYINYCIRCANEYKSRVRLAQLGALQEKTMSDIFTLSQNQALQNKRMLGFLIVALVVLMAALIFIIRQMRQLSHSRSQIHRTNVELRERVQELQQTREELAATNERLSVMYDSVRQSASSLSERNEAKERYIANIFTICSDYISKLDDFRKNIYRMIMARRFDEISELTKSPELSHSQIKELYADFDRIFLQIYPDFVDDFNTLLRPEDRVVPRKGDQLTTELRIYALVRLGLNDSVKIAKFLHVSVQTVYNTRQRTRNKAIVPKDTFAEAVKSLGRPAF